MIKARQYGAYSLKLAGRIPSGYVHNINDNGSPVKGKFKKQTETLQFKRRFGDSEVMDADGKPLVVLSTEKAGPQHSGSNPPGLTRSSFILFISMIKARQYGAYSLKLAGPVRNQLYFNSIPIRIFFLSMIYLISKYFVFIY